MSRVLPLLVAVLLAPGPAGAILEEYVQEGQDDAGSARDAPGSPDPATAVPVLPGIVYRARFAAGDAADWYRLDVAAGDWIEIAAEGALVCWRAVDPSGSTSVRACTPGTAIGSDVRTIRATGPLLVGFDGAPQPYSFSFGRNAYAPHPGAFDARLFPPQRPTLPEVAPGNERGPHAVVAVIDTGIDPYHAFFRADALAAHPSTWLPGFPASVASFPLGASLAQDRARWDALRWGEVVTFPGTRIVAAVSFDDGQNPAWGPGRTRIYDENGHGTMVAGLAAGADLARADGDVLIVAVEDDDYHQGFTWARQQPWIDAIVLSAGWPAGVWANPPVGPPGYDESIRRAVEAGKPVFLASGNGLTNTGLAPDHCPTWTNDLTGPPAATRIGAAEPASGNPTWWHCVPADAVARTDVTSPAVGTGSGVRKGTGTSASAPNAAGHFARLLLETRRDGAELAPAAALPYLLNASRPAPPAPGLGRGPSVAGPTQGYGLVDEAAIARALDRIRDGLPPEPRPDVEAWFAADRAVRTAAWPPRPSLDPPSFAQHDDAGSGRDAPETRIASVWVAPGRVYQGNTSGLEDNVDIYAFHGLAGDVVEIRGFTARGCDTFRLLAPDGATAAICAGGVARHTLDRDGTWWLAWFLRRPDHYRFSFGVDAPAPDPLLPAA